ncbi:DUF6443 domain-containing protein [Tunicatimonas pelagia]|uniref:DUF6443 domain-containing protein n=1 Tax=Tunicatimonas pelagia TaxID=931531 RepID=UPI002666A2E4|nr:DUF6443 domain-containing protein [Tunicatimonas pelagia]WKN42515.1 DUF6443 domain-containing protein [Tunicatimonas pelagia]
MIILTGNCNQSSPYNYVQVEAVRSRGKKHEFNLSFLSNGELRTSYDYLDGLGRTVQQVDQAASPAGNDVVLPVEYDALGRTPKQYLPYVASGQSGNYRAGAISDQASFYQTNGDKITNTTHPFSQSVYDRSPLNRIIEQGSVGIAFQPVADNPNNYTIKQSYQTNNANEVRRWQYNYTNQTISSNNFYGLNQLYVSEVRDEDNDAVWEYQDKRGQTVLKKVEGDTEDLYTYYVHDAFNRLRLVKDQRRDICQWYQYKTVDSE